MSKLMMKGNEAMALAALKVVSLAINNTTNELPEYLSRYMKEYGGIFLQAESEIAAINMVYGKLAGVRL